MALRHYVGIVVKDNLNICQTLQLGLQSFVQIIPVNSSGCSLDGNSNISKEFSARTVLRNFLVLDNIFI